MDIGVYRRYLEQLVQEALQNSDGTNSGIYEYLASKKISGILLRHKFEKQRALEEAKKAFEEHRHWPLEIIISHLGVDRSIIKDS